MFTLRWRDHFVRGDFEGEAGEARLRELYLGDGGVVDAFVEALAYAQLAADWREHLIYDRNTRDTPRHPIATAADARRAVASITEPFQLASSSQELYALLDYARRFAIKVTLSVAPVASSLALVRRMKEKAPASLVRSPVVAIVTRPVPRIRPRRVLAYWPTDARLMLVDRAQLQRCVAEAVPGEQPHGSDEPRYTADFEAELATLCAAPLPAGASLTTQEGQLVFDFTAAGAAAFEHWICGLGLLARRHLADNELGDPAVDGSAWATPAPEGSGVTLYEGMFGCIAYAADIRDGSSIANPEKLITLAKAKRTGKLLTGQRVKQVMLIVPVREEAVALAHLVTDGAVDAVVYKSGQYLHDPNVLGESHFVPFPE